MLYILGGVLLVAVMYFVLRGAFKADKQVVAYVENIGQKFSDLEKEVIAKLKDDEQKAMDVFKEGKEDIINEYERIKLRLESLVSLTNKLPASNIVEEARKAAVAVVVVPPVVVAEQPAPVEVVPQ